MPSLPSFKRQQLLLEFAAIKSKCPEGIYLAPEADTPAIWSGVYFVRKGPYSSAILRFELAFPTAYPDIGPLVSFSTEIFHPLLVPLTTYTFASGAVDPNSTLSAGEAERLIPGTFNLKEEFPTWYPRSTYSDASSGWASSMGGGSAVLGTTGDDDSKGETPNLLAMLQHIKKSFESVEFLDKLPLRAAVNTNAWHAWRAHRGLPKLGSRSISPASVESGHTPLSPGRHPGDWNWDGVWESRVNSGIEESTSDAKLFGNKNNRSTSAPSIIRFCKNDDEKTQEIQVLMLQATSMNSACAGKNSPRLTAS